MKRILWVLSMFLFLFTIMWINNVYADDNNYVCQKQTSTLKARSNKYVLKKWDKILWTFYASNDRIAKDNCMKNKFIISVKSVKTNNTILWKQLMKWYITSKDFINWNKTRYEKVKDNFNSLANSWDMGFNWSQIIDWRKALSPILRNLKLVDPKLVKTKFDWSKNREIINLTSDTPEAKVVKKMLVSPFTSTWWKYNKNQIYVESWDDTLKVYQRPNLKMVMWVVKANNKKWQEFIKNRYCDNVLCVYNTNGDLLVYPNLSPNIIKSFNMLNCAWDWKNFNCDDNKTPAWIPSANPLPSPDLPNDTPKPIPNNPKNNPEIPSLPQIWSPIPHPSKWSCGNWKLDKWEQCDITAWGSWNTLDVCNAPWTTNECKFKIPNWWIAPDVDWPFNNDLYCWAVPWDTITSGWVTYTIVSVKGYPSKNATLDTSNPHYDILTFTWYYNVIAKSSTWAIISKNFPLRYKLKKTYLEFWDFDWNGTFDGKPLKDIVWKDLGSYGNIKELDNIKDLIVKVDTDKVTSKYNMQNKVWKYFVNTDKLDTESYNVISRISTIKWANWVCQGSWDMYTVNYFKKFWNLTTKPEINPINISFPNLVSVDSLDIQQIVNDNSKISFPALQKVPLLLKIQNDNINTISMPVLNEIWWRINKDYDLSKLDNTKISDLTNYVNKLWFFIEGSQIKHLNMHNLTYVWKNISIFYSSVRDWKNHITRIIPILSHYVEDLYNMGLSKLNRDIVYQWEWWLYMKDDWSHHMPLNSFNKLKQLWALVLMWISNQKINLSSIDWIYNGIFLRFANNNDINLMGLSKLWVILANWKKTLIKDECSDDYVKQFRADNFSSWDLENSSNNIIHHWNLRYMWFVKDKFTWPFLQWIQKYINPNVTHIGISPAYNKASNGNKIDFIQNFTCINKKWDGKIWNQWLYFYDDSEDWKSSWYNKKQNWLWLFKKLSKLQSYMYVKDWNGTFQRKILPNEKHLEIIYNMPISKSISPKILYNIAMKIPWINTPKPAPWLWAITQDWKEGSVMITLWKAASSSSSYTAYTPVWVYHWSSCIPIVDYDYYCNYDKLYEKDTKYDSCSGSWTITSVIYNWPYRTRSPSLPSCTNSTRECTASSDYKDALVKSYVSSTNAYLWQHIIKNWCVVTSSHCDDKHNLIIKYYNNDTESPSNLFNTKIYPKSQECYDRVVSNDTSSIVPVSTPPTKTVDILTYLGSTDLIVNENTPAIHSNDWTVYGLSNYLWLSRIDTHTRKAYSVFTTKDIFYFTDSNDDKTLSEWDKVYVIDDSWDKVDIWEYTGSSMPQWLWIYIPTTWNADSNYYYFPVKFSSKLSKAGGTWDLWVYWPVYLLTCEDSPDTICHYNDNDYQYFAVNGKEYVIWRYTHPWQVIHLKKNDGSIVNVPVKDSYKIFVKKSNWYWQDLWSVLDVPNWTDIKLKWATVNDNDTVNLYYTENWNDKAIVLSGL